jgi:hypothetical protein
MNTPDGKPIKKRVLNSKLLPIAAVVLIVLALLFMATPLLRPARGFQRSGNFVPQGNGQTAPQNGFPGQGNRPQAVPGQGGSNFPNRQFAFTGIGFLGGITGAIVFFIALLVSLVAAVGMFLTKRWGQILGIIIAILYALAGLVSLLPILFIGSLGLRNPLSLILGIAHEVLAVAVIVLASIPAKKLITPAVAEEPPPAASV